MKSANQNAAGPALLAGQAEAQAATQAAWRFLNNDNVTLLDLVEPLRELGLDRCQQSESEYVLLAHDWCKLDFKSHSSKRDVHQITHEHDIGYEMSTSLLVDASCGAAIAPMQMHLKTRKKVHSTAKKPPTRAMHRLDHLTPTMKESQTWELPRKVVHVIDREADALGRMREWHAGGHLFLVRCDDRRVKSNDESVLINELVAKFDSEGIYESVGEAKHRGKTVQKEVAETEVVLYRAHSEVVDGEKKSVSGAALTLRLVCTRLLDEDDFIVAEWTLLTNVLDESVSADQIANWYYWRWRIESYFKLLKSHGQNLEQWQQQTGEAIARRILVASMACAMVLELQHDDSEDAIQSRKILVRLSGRQMKYGTISTAPALLAGYMTLLSITDLLTQTDIDVGTLKRMAKEIYPAALV